MSKKPDFEISREKRLQQIQKELKEEASEEAGKVKKTIQTTLIIESELHYAVQELGLKRRRMGIKPYTLTGMMTEALESMIAKEKT